MIYDNKRMEMIFNGIRKIFRRDYIWNSCRNRKIGA